MAMRLGKLYDALGEVGATGDRTSEAAEEVATCDIRTQTTLRKLSRLEALQWATSSPPPRSSSASIGCPARCSAHPGFGRPRLSAVMEAPSLRRSHSAWRTHLP